MAKTERIQAEEVEQTPGYAWGIGAAAWFVPGLGHALLKKFGRAALMGGAVLACFVIGLVMGGHMFAVSTDQSSSQILVAIPMIGNVGMGAPYIVSWLAGYGFADDPTQAARATYEYGNIFLLIGGLLNYLAMLDAFDIAAGRKP